MGGRKTYSVKKVIGDRRKFPSESKQFISALKEKNPKKIAQSTIEMFQKSDTALSNLSKALEMAKFIAQTKKELPPSEIRKRASNYWIKQRAKKRIKASPEIDRILVNSAVKVLRKKEKKKNE